MIKEIFVSHSSNSSIDPASDLDAGDDSFDLAQDEFELPVDIARKGGYLIIRAPVIGVKPEDINITINNDVLFIHKHATSETEKFDNYYVKECHWGPVGREVNLPVAVDPTGTEAALQDGVLRITLPIIAKPKTKIIKIN